MIKEKSKKAQGMSLSVVVIAAVALVVLIVLILIFTGKISVFGDQIDKCPAGSKQEDGPMCGDNNDLPLKTIRLKGGDLKVCCKKT